MRINKLARFFPIIMVAVAVHLLIGGCAGGQPSQGASAAAPPTSADAPSPAPPAPVITPAAAAANIAEAAADAAVTASTRPDASSDSIVSAAARAALDRAVLLAPSAAVDPEWQAAIRSAIAIGIALSKSDNPRPVVDRGKVFAHVEAATLRSRHTPAAR